MLPVHNRDTMEEFKSVAYLVDQDAAVLAQELLRANLLKKEVVDHLSSLPPEVPNLMRHKYLFSEVYQTTNKDRNTFLRMIEVLLHLPVSLVDTNDGTLISSMDVSSIGEILAGYASKWRLIGTALRFRPQELDSIEYSVSRLPDSAKHGLLNLLSKWATREYSYTLPPTLRSLDQALNSQLVGLGPLACEVRKKFSFEVVSKPNTSQFQSEPYMVTSINLSVVDEEVEDQCQNADHIEVQENESVLFEVQAVFNKEEVMEKQKYAWLEVGAHGSRHVVSSTPFLCIRADICRNYFQYSCKVTTKYPKKENKELVPLSSEKSQSSVSYPAPTLLDGERNEFGLARSPQTSQSIFLVPISMRTSAVILHVHSPLDSIRDDLISIYLAQPEIPEDTWPPISSKKFINLALIKQESANYRNKFTQLTVRGDMDDILKDKETIEYKGLVHNLKAKDVLFIEGRPGSGKTTLVHKISRDWSNSPQAFSRTIRALFLVSLRVLNTLKKPSLGLNDILDLFSKQVKVTKELLEDRKGKGVCFIFDGLDEFSPPDGEDSIINQIINKEYLSQSIVIVASRPVATAHLRSKATKVVEVLGFRKDQIFEYFCHYPFSEAMLPSEKTKKEKLSTYLTTHPNILHMCYLPIHAVMIAFIFETTGSVPKTETEIYSHFARFTVMRSIYKTNAPSENIMDIQCLGKEEQYKLICELALKKTILNEQVLHQEEMKVFSKEKNSDACLGLLTLDRTAGLYGLRNVYTFLHLTFQEYLAACHISKLTYERQIELIEEHASKSHSYANGMEVLLWVSGI